MASVATSARGRHRAKPDSDAYGTVFEPLKQAMVTDVGPIAAAAAAERRLAERGIGLADGRDAMQHACTTVGQEPGYDAMRSLCQSWTECTFSYLGAPSCEDPRTGSATAQHLLSRLADLYRAALREAECLPETHVLVVLEPITIQPIDSELAALAESSMEVFGAALVGQLLARTRRPECRRRPESQGLDRAIAYSARVVGLLHQRPRQDLAPAQLSSGWWLAARSSKALRAVSMSERWSRLQAISGSVAARSV